MKLRWAAQAKKELASIIRFIAERDPDVADVVDARIHEAASQLLVYPYMGVSGRVEGTRELFVKKRYVLVYAVSDKFVRIVSVLHTSQQYPPQ